VANWGGGMSASCTLQVQLFADVGNKGAYKSIWIGNPSHSYGASPAIWDHTVLPATRHRCERAPPKTQPGRPVLDLPTPEGWKAELTLVVGYIPKWFTCPQTVTHPGTNQLIATRPGNPSQSYGGNGWPHSALRYH